MVDQAISVVGAGAVTSIGLSFSNIMPAIRAQLDNFQETHFYDNEHESIIGGKIKVHDLNEEGKVVENIDDVVIGGLENQFQWSCMAMDEALSYINLEEFQEYCLIVIGPNKDQPNLINHEELYQKLVDYSRTIISEESLYHLHLPLGETSPAAALVKAQKWVYESQAPKRAVILLGADSWLTINRINHGLKNKRILSESQPEGFIPAEGASAIILTKEIELSNEKPTLTILSSCIDSEPQPLFSELNSTADGLTIATKKALKQSAIEAHDIELLLPDLAGEDYFFTEIALAWGRILRIAMPDYSEKHYIPTYTGHLGAINGLFLLGYAWALNIKGQHPGKNTLIQLTSEDTNRAAIVAVAN